VANKKKSSASTADLAKIAEQAKFESGKKFQNLKDFNPAWKASQKSIEILESLTALDLASAVPYIKISQLVNGELVDPPLNAQFSRPPEFGAVIGDRGRFGERPPVSIERLQISTKQNVGYFILQEIELDIVVHRPSVMFDVQSGRFTETDENRWASLITPGKTHIVHYGWKGASRNPLFNGEGFDDDESKDYENNPTVIDSVKSIAMTTYYYTFSLTQNGEIKIKIKGWQNGDYVLRNLLVGENKDTKAETNKDAQSNNEVPIQHFFAKVESRLLKEVLQKRIRDFSRIEKESGKVVTTKKITIEEAINALGIGESISEIAIKFWGYNDVKLVIGGFNDLIPTESAKAYGAKDYKGMGIGEFEVNKDDIIKMIGEVVKNGVQLNVKVFLSNIINFVNNPASWGSGIREINNTKFSTQPPTVLIKVIEQKAKGKQNKDLLIIIFDLKKELIKFNKGDEITEFKGRESTRAKVKEKLKSYNIPFISLGGGTSFIKNAEFEVIMDNDIQRAKIEEASNMLERQQLVSSTSGENKKEVTENFHLLWSSALQGNMTMLGNFALDTFGFIWIDFGVPLWDGVYNIRKRTDTLSAGEFSTMIELYSEASDPLNTRHRKTPGQILKKKRMINIEIDASQAASKKGSNTKQIEAKRDADLKAVDNTSDDEWEQRANRGETA